MKRAQGVFIFLVCIFLCSQAFAQQPLHIATEGAYPPFNFIDKNGDLAGFDVDIALALCESMQVECVIEAVQWDDILNGLVAGSYDAIVASMAKTPEREKVASFTDFYYRSRSTFVGDPKKQFVQTTEGVKGMILAAQTETVQLQYLMNNFSGSAKIQGATTIKEAFAMLVRGDVDAVLSDSLTIYDFLQTDVGRSFDFIGTPLPQNDPSSESRIAVAKGNTKLVDAFNKALKEIRLNGTYDKVNRRYFPFSIY